LRDIDSWDDFVNHHPNSIIYHFSGFHRAIKNTYTIDPLYITIIDGQGKIRSGLPVFMIDSRFTSKRMTSLPLAQYCNPLVRNKNDLHIILNYVMELLRIEKVDYFELKTSSEFDKNQCDFGEQDCSYHSYNLDLKLPLDDIYKNFHNSCIQRGIKKAHKNGLQFQAGRSEEDVLIFYDLYQLMRKNYGLLPQPRKFFINLWRELAEMNYIDILHSKYQQKIISSALLLKFNDQVIYEYGATLPGMKRLRGSQFLLWESIKQSKQQNYKKYDFGRTANNNIGLSKYKSRWGARRLDLNYLYWPKLKGFASKKERRIARRAMNMLTKKTPAIFSRNIGRLLYKHFL